MARLISRQPLPNQESLQNQLSRLCDDRADKSDRPFTEKKGIAWTPRIELQDALTVLKVQAELPGVEAKDLDVQVSRDAVAIAGFHRQKPMHSWDRYRSEFRYGHFRRVIQLPEAVQNDQLQAELKDGILYLTLPKLSAVRPTVVKVNVSDLETATESPLTLSPNPELTEKGQVSAFPDPEILEDVWAPSDAA